MSSHRTSSLRLDEEDPFTTFPPPSSSTSTTISSTAIDILARPPIALTPTASFSLSHQHTTMRPQHSPTHSSHSSSGSISSRPSIKAINTNDAATSSPSFVPPLARTPSLTSHPSTATFHTAPSPPRTPISKRVTFPASTPAAPRAKRTSSPAKRLTAGLPSLNLGDLFTLQGTSAPVGFGVLPLPSPTPSTKSEVGAGEVLGDAKTDGARPRVKRSGSTLGQAAASLLGLSGGGGGVAGEKQRERGRTRTLEKLNSRVEKQLEEKPFRDGGKEGDNEKEEEEDRAEHDPWLTCSVEKALFTGKAVIPSGFSDEAYNALAANARLLFTKLHTAYVARHDTEMDLRDEVDDLLDERDATVEEKEVVTKEKAATKEELEEAYDRIACLKEQLGDLGQRLADETEGTARLRGEVREMRMRRRCSVRLVSGGVGKETQDDGGLVMLVDSDGRDEGETVERLFSASGDGIAPGGYSGGDMRFEDSRPGSASSACSSGLMSERDFSRPETPRSVVSTAPSSAPDHGNNSNPSSPIVRKSSQEVRASAAFWRDAAPFLKPDGGETKLRAENDELRTRVRELEATIEGCLGLVD